jgi:hypothetical protein
MRVTRFPVEVDEVARIGGMRAACKPELCRWRNTMQMNRNGAMSGRLSSLGLKSSRYKTNPPLQPTKALTSIFLPIDLCSDMGRAMCGSQDQKCPDSTPELRRPI